MRRKGDVMGGIGGFALALASMAWPAPASASAITYNTGGSVTPAGFKQPDGSLVGPGVVGVAGVTGGSFDLPGTIALGSLVVTPSSNGMSSTYTDVPFSISFNAPDLYRTSGSGDDITVYNNVFTLTGHLDGTVRADGQADLTATVDGFSPLVNYPVTPGWHYVDGLPFSMSDLTTAPTFHLTTPAGGGSVAIDVQAVPEPSTLAFAGAVLAGLLLRRRSLRRG